MTIPSSPSGPAEAIREVLIANQFRPAREAGSLDDRGGTKLHKRFYIEGPTLQSSDPTSGQIVQRWGMSVVIAFPEKTADPDLGQFDAADEISALDAQLQNDTTLKGGAFRVDASAPEWNEELEAWVVELVTHFHVGVST